MSEIHCQCGVQADVTAIPPQAGLPLNWELTFVEEDAACFCRFAMELGPGPINLRRCPELTRAVEAAAAAGRFW